MSFFAYLLVSCFLFFGNIVSLIFIGLRLNFQVLVRFVAFTTGFGN